MSKIVPPAINPATDLELVDQVSCDHQNCVLTLTLLKILFLTLTLLRILSIIFK